MYSYLTIGLSIRTITNQIAARPRGLTTTGTIRRRAFPPVAMDRAVVVETLLLIMALPALGGGGVGRLHPFAPRQPLPFCNGLLWSYYYVVT